MTVYSQHNEQEFILARAPRTGTFLDIGAWHPTKFSNTRALYERGWSGVLVEPSPGPFLTLLRACCNCGLTPNDEYGTRQIIPCSNCGTLKRYGDDANLKLVLASVGVDAALSTLHVSDDAYSTLDDQEAEKWKHEANYYGKIFVPQLTIDQLISQFGPFHFVNIDAEGLSVDLLYHLLKHPMQPACICAEHQQRVLEVSAWAEEGGYKIDHLNQVNIVLYRRT